MPELEQDFNIPEQRKESRTDHMAYLPDMEVISSDLMEQVITKMNAYDYNLYTAADVEQALSREVLHDESGYDS